jgi:hypothetical protein
MTRPLRFVLAWIFVSTATFSGSARGDSILNLDLLISGSPPSTPPPWMTLDFHTNNPGDVTLTITNNMSSAEFTDTVLFNVVSGIDPASLTYAYLSDVQTSGIAFNTNGGNQIKAGVFSIDFEYPTASGQTRLAGSTSSVYKITGDSITASSFLALSTLDQFSVGTFQAAAHVQGIPGGLTGSIGAVPEPASITTGVMGVIGVLGFYRRLKRSRAGSPGPTQRSRTFQLRRTIVRRQSRSLMTWVVAFLVCVLSPTLALAESVQPAWVSIGEGESPVQTASISDSGFSSTTNPPSYGGVYNPGNTTITTVNEGVGVLGDVDMHVQYIDSTPLANGVTQIVNFNIVEVPGSTTISDTLNITFTGQTPTASDANNMEVDLHWRSESTDGVRPPALANAHIIDEVTFANVDLIPFVIGDTGLSDFHIRTNSVPEPSSVVMMGLSALGLLGCAVRRRSRTRA